MVGRARWSKWHGMPNEHTCFQQRSTTQLRLRRIQHQAIDRSRRQFRWAGPFTLAPLCSPRRYAVRVPGLRRE